MTEEKYPTDFCNECKHKKHWEYTEEELEKYGMIAAIICGLECPFYIEKEMNKDKLNIEIKMDWEKYTEEELKSWEERKENWKGQNKLKVGKIE